MRPANWRIALFTGILVSLLTVGCNQGPFGRQVAAPGQPSELQDLNNRASQLDANNQDLHSQLAQSQRNVKTLANEVSLLKDRLADVTGQLKTEAAAKRETEDQIRALRASTRHRGGATLRANSSLKNSLRTVDIEGVDVRQEGDVIRIEIPGDDVFRPGDVNYQRGAVELLSDVANTVARSYRRNRVVIEAHVDSKPVAGVSAHELTASQALAVFDVLTTRGRLPEQQLTILSMGSNMPLASNATQAGRERNRRIELVVYPEQFE
ncbi:MAG: OmpA family protein [Pirellulaceae bacterium]|jgi:flagellar motor protein MotB|nr:OmpA family protein [Pirellulaceae bacterium]MDP7017468.1 OmpA family protein [Pirellulaceae bacterium]